MLEDYNYSARSQFQDQLTIVQTAHERIQAQKDDYIQKLEAQARQIIAERERTIVEQNRALTEKNELVNNNQETIHELVKRNLQVQEAMKKQQELIAELLSSKKAFQALAIKYGYKIELSSEQKKENFELAKKQVMEGVDPANVQIKHI